MPTKKTTVSKAVSKKTARKTTRKATRNPYLDASFSTYIYRVLRAVHPDGGLTGEALATVNNLIKITLTSVVENINLLMRNTPRMTISAREVQNAVRLTLPGELAKHAVSDGTKAVTKYSSDRSEAAGKGEKVKPKPRARRAGLNFPIPRIENIMMELATAKRKSDTSAVYLAAVLEYITAEILELAGNAARDNKQKRITPRNITMAIEHDEELDKLFHDVVMSGGVVVDAPVKEEKPRARKGGARKGGARKGAARKTKGVPGVKKPRTAFIFFSQEHRNEVKTQNPDKSFGEIGKLVGDAWKAASAAAKKKYEDMAEADKKRYEAEAKH